MLLLLLSRLSCVQLCATPQTAAHQAPPSLGFSRQEHWSGLPFPSPMHEVKSESEVAQLCLTLHDPMDCSLPGSSIHGIFQARVLEWGAIAFSGKSSYKSLKLLKVFLKNISNTIHKYQVKHFEKLHTSTLLLSLNLPYSPDSPMLQHFCYWAYQVSCSLICQLCQLFGYFKCLNGSLCNTYQNSMIKSISSGSFGKN